MSVIAWGFQRNRHCFATAKLHSVPVFSEEASTVKMLLALLLDGLMARIVGDDATVKIVKTGDEVCLIKNII